MSTSSWKNKRNEVLSRDDHACRFCDISEEEHNTEYGDSLSIHHIIPKGDGGSDDVDNLITVCKSCHRTLEKTHGKAVGEINKKQTFKKDILSINEVREDFYKTIDEVENTAEKFIDNYPTLKKELDVCVSEEGRIQFVNWSQTRHIEYPESELEFIFLLGYREGLINVVADIEGRSNLPEAIDDER